MNSNSEQKVIRSKYSAQFKDQAVERAEKDGVPQVAKDLGIAEAMLYSWRSRRNKAEQHSNIRRFSKRKWRD